MVQNEKFCVKLRNYLIDKSSILTVIFVFKFMKIEQIICDHINFRTLKNHFKAIRCFSYKLNNMA